MISKLDKSTLDDLEEIPPSDTKEFEEKYLLLQGWMMINETKRLNLPNAPPHSPYSQLAADRAKSILKKYLNENDKILKWFKSKYEQCEITEDPSTYLTIDEVFLKLKEFDLYKNLNKSVKKYLTKQSLINKFKEHDWFKSGYEKNLIKYTKVKDIK